MKRSFAVVRRVGMALGLLLGLGGCHSTPAVVPSGTPVLQFSPQTATVLLDDQPLLLRAAASAPARVRVATGPHRLEVRAIGYLTRFQDVQVQTGADSVLSVSLHPDPESDLEPQGAATQPFAPRPRELPALP